MITLEEHITSTKDQCIDNSAHFKIMNLVFPDTTRGTSINMIKHAEEILEELTD